MLSGGRAGNRSRGKLRASSAAQPRRNRRTVRASARVPEEGADLVGSFQRKDVLELAGLLLDLRFAVHCQTVSKQALSQAVPADDAARPFAAAGREFHNQSAIADGGSDRLERIMTGIHKRFVIVGMWWMRRR